MRIHAQIPLPEEPVRFGDIAEMIAAAMFPPTEAELIVKRRFVWRDERYFSQKPAGERGENAVTDEAIVRDLDSFRAKREKDGALAPDDRGQIVIGEEPADPGIGRGSRFWACVEAYSRELERAVENSDLTPLNPLTLLPHPFPFGQALKSSLVALDDLKRWGEAVGIAFVDSKGSQKNETPIERRARLRARHKELKASGDNHPTKTLAEEENISTTQVRNLIRVR